MCACCVQSVWLVVSSRSRGDHVVVSNLFYEMAAQSLRHWRGQVHIVSQHWEVSRVFRECNEAHPIKFVPSCDRLELTASPQQPAELSTVLTEIFSGSNRVVDTNVSLAGTVNPGVSVLLVHWCDQLHSQFVRQNVMSYLAGTPTSVSNTVSASNLLCVHFTVYLQMCARWFHTGLDCSITFTGTTAHTWFGSVKTRRLIISC